MFRVVVVLLLGMVVFVGCSEEGVDKGRGRDNGDDAFLVGIAEVRDGDSLKISGEEVRLLGIDAPEYDQRCGEAEDVWDCGEAAKEMLEAMVMGREVRCSLMFRDAHERWLSRCFVAGDGGKREDLGKMMVAGGMAVARGREYRELMRGAKAERRGIWKGCFSMPERWRKGSRECWFR